LADEAVLKVSKGPNDLRRLRDDYAVAPILLLPEPLGFVMLLTKGSWYDTTHPFSGEWFGEISSMTILKQVMLNEE
jgi:hypothetical protein